MFLAEKRRVFRRVTQSNFIRNSYLFGAIPCGSHYDACQIFYRYAVPTGLRNTKTTRLQLNSYFVPPKSYFYFAFFT
jgi:hypothetical protein